MPVTDSETEIPIPHYNYGCSRAPFCNTAITADISEKKQAFKTELENAIIKYDPNQTALNVMQIAEEAIKNAEGDENLVRAFRSTYTDFLDNHEDIKGAIVRKISKSSPLDRLISRLSGPFCQPCFSSVGTSSDSFNTPHPTLARRELVKFSDGQHALSRPGRYSKRRRFDAQQNSYNENHGITFDEKILYATNIVNFFGAVGIVWLLSTLQFDFKLSGGILSGGNGFGDVEGSQDDAPEEKAANTQDDKRQEEKEPRTVLDYVTDEPTKVVDNVSAGASPDDTPYGMAMDPVVGTGTLSGQPVEILPGIYFASGGAEIISGLEAIKVLADSMNAGDCPIVSLYGHTDSVGSETDNLELSLRRALSVRSVLTQQYNVNAQQIHFFAMGESQPLLRDNPTHPDNRRVEFRCNPR